jgi:hypothetical protein
MKESSKRSVIGALAEGSGRPPAAAIASASSMNYFSKPAGLMRDPLRYRSAPLCTVAGPYPPPRDVVIRVKYTSIAFAANGLAIGNAAANPWGSRDMPT